MSVVAAPGQHALLDLYECDVSLLSDPDRLGELLTTAAIAGGATVLDTKLHHFGGNEGVTGVVLLAESHISIHTWPEIGFAAVDVFMCGNCDPNIAAHQIQEGLSPQAWDWAHWQRGAKL